MTSRQSVWQEKQRVKGGCINCGRERGDRAPRWQTCERCAALSRKRSRRRMILMLRDRRCISCGDQLEAVPPVRCEACLVAMRVAGKHYRQSRRITQKSIDNDSPAC